MNTDSPSPSTEEGAISAPFEKLPKLNLPPKPVLATAVTTETTSLSSPPAIKQAPELPSSLTSTVSPSTSAQVLSPKKKPEVTETPALNKKRAALSLPLAMIAFLVALLGLFVQLLAFLHLF